MKVICFILLVIFVLQVAIGEPIRNQNHGNDQRVSLQDAIEHVESHAKSILENIKAEKESLLVASLNSIVDSYTKEILAFENEITEMEKSLSLDPSLIPCLDAQKANIVKIVGDVRAGVLKCATGARDEILKLQQLLEGLEGKIVAQIEILRNVLEKCGASGTPIATFSCVVQNVRQIDDAIKTIAGSVVEVINDATPEIKNIITNTRTCVLSVVSVGRTEIEGIVNTVKDCLSPAN